MSSSPPTAELCSWKEIASYLGVSVKTAQVWEATRGLPVRRYPGARVQVRALVGELEAWKLRGDRPSPAVQPVAMVPGPRVPRYPVGGRWWYVGVSLLAISLLGVAALRTRPSGVVLGEFHLLTSDEGLELHPALSPLGDRVAFVQVPTGGQPTLMVLELDSGQRHRAAVALAGTVPRWSPRGALAYFGFHLDGVVLHCRDPRGFVRDVAVLRGRDRQSEALNALTLDWLGEHEVVFSDRSPGGSLQLVKLNVLTGARAVLTRPEGGAGDVQPAIDGDLLAFVRYQSNSEGDVYLRDLRSGAERRLSRDHARIDGLAWLPQHDGLLVASMRSRHALSLYHLTLDGNMSRLTTGEGFVQFPHVVGNTLVVQRTIRDSNIWEHKGTTHVVSPSTAFEGSPSYSPDGTRLAFISKRSGPTELWLTSPTGEPVQLTTLGQTFTDSPRWSPDGRRIAFTSHKEGNRDIYLVDVQTKHVQRFTTEESEEGRPSWSGDGNTVYFRSDRTGTPEIWKQPLNGMPVQLTTRGGFEAFEAPDAQLVYYIKQREQHELWSIPARGGTEQLERDGITESRWYSAQQGIYFLRTLENPAIMQWNPKTRQEHLVLSLPPQTRLEGGFTSTPDATAFTWTQTDKHEADILRATIHK